MEVMAAPENELSRGVGFVLHTSQIRTIRLGRKLGKLRSLAGSIAL
jgi:hypothetical protein